MPRVVGLVVGPLVDVAGHVVGAERAHAVGVACRCGRACQSRASSPSRVSSFIIACTSKSNVAPVDVARARLADEPPREREALGPLAREDPLGPAAEPLARARAERLGLVPVDVDQRVLPDPVRPLVAVDAVAAVVGLLQATAPAQVLGAPDVAGGPRAVVRQRRAEVAVDQGHVGRAGGAGDGVVVEGGGERERARGGAGRREGKGAGGPTGRGRREGKGRGRRQRARSRARGRGERRGRSGRRGAPAPRRAPAAIEWRKLRILARTGSRFDIGWGAAGAKKGKSRGDSLGAGAC